MSRILIIEDDEAIAAVEKDYLEMDHHQVVTAADGLTGLKLAREESFDLILLDVMLPGLDGFALCRKMRETLDIPILMVTAKGEDEDKIRGLGLGADDYMEKPFSPGVLMARVRANLAQYARLKKENPEDAHLIQIGDLQIYRDTRRVYMGEKEIELKNKEYEVLLFLAQSPDVVFSRETLYERIWGMEAMGDNATVAVHINRIRDKMGEDPARPRYIQTVRGAGYRLKK